MTSPNLGFGVASRGARSMAVFSCKHCAVERLYALTGMRRLNPEKVAGWASRDGWRADPYSTSVTLCPNCAGQRYDNDPNSEIKKMEQKMARQQTITLTAQKVPPPGANGAVATSPPPASDPALTVTTPAPATLAPASPTRDPAPDQRAAIRGHLEQSFDETLGYYRDGCSDARIAELVGVPRAVVERLREAAYGPLRVSAEVINLRTEGQSLRAELEALRDEAKQLDEKVVTWLSRVARAINPPA